MNKFNIVLISFFSVAMLLSEAQDVVKLNLNYINGHGGFESRPASKKLDFRCNEISGICPSVKHINSYWVHEDSGSGPFVYLISDDGKRQGAVELKEAMVFDCEDIALDMSVADQPKIVVADIGDNFRMRPYISFYRFAEPKNMDASDTILVNVESTHVSYPILDKPYAGIQDCEAFFVDPLDGVHYLVTKHEGQAHIFSFTWISNPSKPSAVSYVASLRLHNQRFCAADISADGTELVFKTYHQIFHWHRDPNKSIAETIKQQPTRLPYLSERQGESICYSLDKNKYFTISEVLSADAFPYLRVYSRK